VPNALAYLMLLIWPVVVTVLYLRCAPRTAAIWSVVAGYLILPPAVAIDLPMIPGLDKISIPALSAWLGARLIARVEVPLLPASAAGRVLVVLLFVAPFATALANRDPVAFTERDLGWMQVQHWVPPLPALTLYDAVSMAFPQVFVLMTLALARRFLADAEGLRALAVALVAAGVAYSFPMLLEVRLSPQLNTWIYGYFQHSFLQMMRGDGFRPIVFLSHGLWVAFLAFTCFAAALALARTDPPPLRRRWWLIAVWLGFVLVLCKSMAALVYGILALAVLGLAGHRLWLRLAVLMAVLVLAYPLLRAQGLVPTDALVEFVAGINPDRAQSLGFRFDNEEGLLARALERPWFGWGGYGRNGLHDPWTGRLVSISDGEWIIALGITGIAGFIAQFGLLALPLVLLLRRVRAPGYAPLASALALIHGYNLADLIPNATVTPLTWLIAGALLGHAESLARAGHARASGPAPASGAPPGTAAPARPRTIL
jgi:O-antigen ligase